ncbi:hypothetical protein [Streptomyces sp. NPDC010273]|uniref:hypothetical protein n=1 Tax=Streptomyces sp. NPDC010273 TaxID=3364829 RepID=UPI0036EF3084
MDLPPFNTTPTRVGWDTSALDPLRPVAEARHRTRVWLQEHWKLGELAGSVELAVGGCAPMPSGTAVGSPGWS